MKLSTKVVGVLQYKEKKDIELTGLSADLKGGDLCD
jgi:hypothetical protein